MAMGIVSDKEFDSELSRANNKPESNSTPAKVEIIEKGRGNGNVGVPNGLRRIIGETAISDGRDEALELAKHFGISPSSVGAYTSGATSTSSYNNKPNGDVIKTTKEKIGKRARMKLMRALHHITDEKLSEAKVSDIAAVARSMSAVVKDMEPEIQKPEGNSGPTFVFYSPQFRKEENYEVVYAKE